MYRDPSLRFWQLEGGQLASLLHHLIFKANPNNFYKPTCCATFSCCSCSTARRFECGTPDQDEMLPLHSPRPECVRCCSASTTDITCWSFWHWRWFNKTQQFHFLSPNFNPSSTSHWWGHVWHNTRIEVFHPFRIFKWFPTWLVHFLMWGTNFLLAPWSGNALLEFHLLELSFQFQVHWWLSAE